MPIIKNAKRALRVSKLKALENQKTKKDYEIAIRAAKKKRDKKSVATAFSFLDRASKKSVIHKNKAARLKSSLSKLL